MFRWQQRTSDADCDASGLPVVLTTKKTGLVYVCVGGALTATEKRLISSFTSRNEIAFEEADNWQRGSGGKKKRGLRCYF